MYQVAIFAHHSHLPIKNHFVNSHIKISALNRNRP